jgi:hypothetical protein
MLTMMAFNTPIDEAEPAPALPDQGARYDDAGRNQQTIAPVRGTGWLARLAAILGKTVGVLVVAVLQLILVIYLETSLVPAIFPLFSVLIFPPSVFVSAALIAPIAAIADILVLRKHRKFFAQLALLLSIAVVWTLISTRVLMFFPPFAALGR